MDEIRYAFRSLEPIALPPIPDVICMDCQDSGVDRTGAGSCGMCQFAHRDVVFDRPDDGDVVVIAVKYNVCSESCWCDSAVVGYASVHAIPIYKGGCPGPGPLHKHVCWSELDGCWLLVTATLHDASPRIDINGAEPGGTALILTALPVQADNPNQTGTVWDRGDGKFWLIVDDSDGREPPAGLPLPAIGNPISVEWDTTGLLGRVKP